MMLNTITEGILKWKVAREATRTCRAVTVAICSRKGGVGKTTATVHLAVAAARWHARRVLVIDMDPQGHVVTALSSFVRRDSAAALSSVFMEKKGDLLEAAIPTDVPNLWVVPADDRLEQVQMLLATRIGREFVLKQLLHKAEDMFDLILIDCPPNLDTLTLNALVAAHQVVIPTDLSLLGVEGVSDIVEAIETVRERLGLPLLVGGVLVTRVDSRNKAINRELDRLLEQRFGSLLFNSRVPNNTAVPRACLEGRPVFDFEPGCRGAQGYLDATDELLDRIDA
jgi:chromosome partitioning protein